MSRIPGLPSSSTSTSTPYSSPKAKPSARSRRQLCSLSSSGSTRPARPLHWAMWTNVSTTSRSWSYVTRLRRPPFSIDLFNGDEVNLVTDYIVDTYFRHFKLYKYIFTRQIRLDLTISYAGIPETPPALEEEIPVTEQEEGPPEEAEPSGEAGMPDRSDQELRQYIGARLAQQVLELRTAMEGRVREGEQRLNQRLAALEALNSPRSPGRLPRGRRK
ncbi:cilia- and flagella-associated protein 119 isoform X1 [Cetorhinus maximus]